MKSITTTNHEENKLWLEIKNWKPQREMFFLRYAHVIAASVAGAGSFLIADRFRRRYKLLGRGRVVTYLPVVILPMLTTSILQSFNIERLVEHPERCPVCLVVRATAFQTLAGFIYPLCLAPVASLSLAVRYFTVTVPKGSKAFFDFTVKDCLALIKKRQRLFAGVALSQAMVGAALISLQMRAVIKVREKMLLSGVNASR